MASFLANIISLGGAGRVEEAAAAYQQEYNRYQRYQTLITRKRDEVAETLQALLTTKKSAYCSLKRMREVTANLSPRERQLAAQHPLAHNQIVDMQAVERTINAGDLATSSAAGVGAGLSTAAGAWALVGAFGSASTGTALSTLSGVALTNATLAWFGGGSLAAGGLGMVGGAAVLGGLALAPAAIITAGFAHVRANRKVAEIAEAGKALDAEMGKLQQAERTLSAIDARARELITALDVAESAFDITVDRAKSRLYGTRWWQRLARWFRQTILRRSFSDEQVRVVAGVGSAATSLAALIDQPVFDASGRPM